MAGSKTPGQAVAAAGSGSAGRENSSEPPQGSSMAALAPTLTGRIVAVHQGALGDCLLALPILEALHRSWPRIHFDLWSKPEHVALLAAKPFMGSMPPPDDSTLARFFHEDLWRTAPVPPFLEQSRMVLIFGQTGSRVLAERLASRLSCPVPWLQSFPGPGACQHVSQFLMEQCRRFGWHLEECLPRLEPAPQDLAAASAWLEQHHATGRNRPIVIHPGSGGLRKVWPLSNWWRALQWLREAFPNPILLSLGPADERLRDFVLAAEALGVAALEGLPLRLLAAVLSQGRLFVGSDSGVSHLAAAVGTPTLVIFGPTDPGVWAPRGPHVHVVRAGWEESEVLAWPPAPSDTASVTLVIKQVKKILAAS